MQVSIIVPVTAEVENSLSLTNRLSHVLANSNLSAEILIVDACPDQETGRNLTGNESIRIISHQGDPGFASAAMTGMTGAAGEILVVIDPTLDPPVEKVPELLVPLIKQEADFVSGSGTSQAASKSQRWLTSLRFQATNWLIRPLTEARNSGTGFFAFFREDFENAQDHLNPAASELSLELLVKCRLDNIVQIPALSTEATRSHTRSWKERLQFAAQLKQLYEYRYKNLAYFAQFAIVGFSGVFVNLLTLSLLLHWLIRPAAVAVAIWVAMTTNFFLNRNITFSYARHAPIFKQYLGYCSSCLAGAVFNWLTTLVLCNTFPFFAQYTLLAAVIGILVGMGFNFLLCRVLVFAKHKTEEPAEISR